MNTTNPLPRVLLAVLMMATAVAAGWIVSRSIAAPDAFHLVALSQDPSSPDFQLIDFNGRPRSLRDYRGREIGRAHV